MNASTAPATLEQAQDMGLTADEFKKIEEILGRTPNFTEMCIYSVMWSEHCSYKNSIKYLKTLPKEGPHMLVKAGEENAGIVDIGDGLGCAFKIESHNHPSALEPYQGAATGVGGINRDIFTMGARPIAQLNSLRFGDLENPRTKWLLEGVVKGIGDYGNSFGVPIVGGEVFFDPCYQVNPLVNAMSVGILETDKIISATASGVGNPVYIVGSATGKDGIQGASFASKDITAESAEDLPAVQVGDPFQEKLLLEATLELAATDSVRGMQDMGAAGITCSTSEMSAAGGVGMDIDLDKVPLRQSDMQPFEILLSESQERMLVVVKKGDEAVVEGIFDKWDLHAECIGTVTEGNQIRFYKDGELVAEVPADTLVLGGGAPVYDREYSEPAWYADAQAWDASSVPVPSIEEAKDIADRLIQSPNIASKKWVWEQYDSMVGTINRSTNRPSDAGVVSVRGTKKAGAHGGLQRALRGNGSRNRNGHRCGRGRPEHQLLRRGAQCHHQLLELRQPLQPGGILAVCQGHRRHGPIVPPLQYAGYRWKRELLQPIGSARRFSRSRFPDPNHWYGRCHRGPRQPHVA